MRKLVLSMFMSLDGFIEGPNREFVGPAWSNEMQTDWADANIDGAGTLLYGRVAYEMNAGYWQSISEGSSQRSFAEKMNGLPKIVFSRTLAAPTWRNSTIVRDDIAAEVTKLKAESGKDIVALGGAGLANTLMKLGAVDEYRFLVTPLVLGDGNPLFKGGYDRFKLKLVSAKALGTGSVLLTYGRGS